MPAALCIVRPSLPDQLLTAGASSSETPKLFLVRATQLQPAARYTAHQHTAALSLPPGGESAAAFAVADGATMEVTLAQFWSSLGGSRLSAELSFHGVTLTTASTQLAGVDGSKQVRLHCR